MTGGHLQDHHGSTPTMPKKKTFKSMYIFISQRWEMAGITEGILIEPAESEWVTVRYIQVDKHILSQNELITLWMRNSNGIFRPRLFLKPRLELQLRWCFCFHFRKYTPKLQVFYAYMLTNGLCFACLSTKKVVGVFASASAKKVSVSGDKLKIIPLCYKITFEYKTAFGSHGEIPSI